jgi:hypothetical protein
MKKIFGKILMGISVIALILSILTGIVAITGLFSRLFTWYKTGEMYRLPVSEFIPSSWMVQLISTWSEGQEIILWILSRDIISFLIEFCLILIFSFFIMYIGAKWCQEKARGQEKSEIVLTRLKNWTSNIL